MRADLGIRKLLPCALLLAVTNASPGLSAQGAAGPFAYVTNRNSASVSVIDTTTNTVTTTVSVGSAPQFIATTPDGDFAWVANALGNSVSVIDLSSNSVATTINVGQIPHAIAFTPDGAFAYVTNKDDDNVWVIDTSTYLTEAVVSLGVPPPYKRPAGIAITPDGNSAYVANEYAYSVSVIDTATNTIQKTVSLARGSAPRWLAVSPAGDRVYVPMFDLDAVAILDTSNNTVVGSIAVDHGSGPFAATFSPNGDRCYVSNNKTNTVSVIDTSLQAVVATVTVGPNPVEMETTPDGAFLYVPTSGNNVVVVDTAWNIVASVQVGSTPWGVSMSWPVYSCQGFAPPMSGGPVRVKKHRALPLKVQLFDGSQNPVTDMTIQAPPVLQIHYLAAIASAVDVSDDALPAGQGTTGNQFQFSDGSWQFNLLTKNFTAPGTYTISLVAGNGYDISPACEATFVIH